MKKEAIRERLTALCADVFQNSEIDVDLVEHADFFDDLGMDSITFITLIVEIEVARTESENTESQIRST